MSYTVPHFINNQLITSTTRSLPIYNPAVGQAIGTLNIADQAIIDQAVTAAHHAFTAWSTTPAPQRAKILFRFKVLLDQHIEKCAALITQEHGKTLAEAISSVQRGIDVVDYTCGIPAHLKGSFAEEVATGIDTYSLRQPLGVCVGITPFNFPGMIPLWMFPMAVACGNTFILKPSEKDPSCSLFLAELAKTAGFPDGVINVIQGDSETVNALLIHPLVKAVSFVGSSTVAEHVYKTAITHNKRAQAFGGAKNHCIVMPDADLDIVADQLVAAAYGCAGERCMAISVVIVVGDKTADQLINKMRPLIMQLKVGPGDEQQTDIGPLITQQHWQRVYEYIELGKQEGAQLIIDGSQDKPAAHKTGFFIGACLFDQVKPSMRIYREEIFGPVLCVLRVPDLASGIQLINTHEYGNGAAIFTRDGYTARTFAEQAQAGMIGINAPIPVPVAYHSFGGWKRSFFADIGMYGDEAVRFYTKLKTVTQRWFPPTTEQST